jgi:NADPH:quinone reductase
VFSRYSTVGPPKFLSSFLNAGEAGPDLAALVTFVADGSLSVDIGWRGAWDRVAEAIGALRGRRVNGKAVLDLRPGRP